MFNLKGFANLKNSVQIEVFYKSILKFVKAHALALSGLFLLFIFLAVTKPLFFILAIFIALGAISTTYKNVLNIGIDFELQSLVTVISGAVYGPTAGVAVGFLSVLIGHVLNFMFLRNPILSLIYAGSFAVLGLISAITPSANLVQVGTIYVLANDIIFVFLGSAFGAPVIRLVIAAIVHPSFVYFLFSSILIPLVNFFGR